MYYIQYWELLMFYLWHQRHFGDVRLTLGKEWKSQGSIHERQYQWADNLKFNIISMVLSIAIFKNSFYLYHYQGLRQLFSVFMRWLVPLKLSCWNPRGPHATCGHTEAMQVKCLELLLLVFVSNKSYNLWNSIVLSSSFCFVLFFVSAAGCWLVSSNTRQILTTASLDMYLFC